MGKSPASLDKFARPRRALKELDSASPDSERLKKLISEDEARALMVLLGLLDDDEQPEEVRHAAGERRFRLGSRLAVPL
ncbi:hypothetical protein PV721_06485 [Streptomyces sp. MB09-01]|uniref:hypothetical protein n=1 Tax=Streptomyces sp. MB09-01 TaxID=3028666 RepID=UPI0029A7108D|nr:hypothetical protein [Streptomyces sp. MB09-01]MDX3534015.1 hypothetical protein [Streptomyces sp. MB09-01]